MVFLNFSSRTSLALRIIESLSNKERLDSREKVQILLGYIRPLLEDSTADLLQGIFATLVVRHVFPANRT